MKLETHCEGNGMDRQAEQKKWSLQRRRGQRKRK